MEKLSKRFNHNFENGNFNLYDKMGNQLYFEDFDGYWSETEYDGMGNQLYFKNSNNYWSKRVYDKDGKQIDYKNSTYGIN